MRLREFTGSPEPPQAARFPGKGRGARLAFGYPPSGLPESVMAARFGFLEGEGGVPAAPPVHRAATRSMVLSVMESHFFVLSQSGGGQSMMMRSSQTTQSLRDLNFGGEGLNGAQEGCSCAISISGREGPRGPMTNRGLRGFREKEGGLPRRSQGRLWLRCLEFWRGKGAVPTFGHTIGGYRTSGQRKGGTPRLSAIHRDGRVPSGIGPVARSGYRCVI
jgi:hypothetical protein